jgi:hypothetical protein
MSKRDLIVELHKPVRINFPRRKYIFKGIDHIWFADLADMQNLKKHNKNYCYILVVIDGFSKLCWTKNLKTKTGIEVMQAFKSIFEETGRSPASLIVDEGDSSINTVLNRAIFILFYSF